jgi:hypothetical protein
MAWKYLPLLNEAIKILLTIALGCVFGRLGIFAAETFVPFAVKYVFFVALPLLVLRGVGIGTDFYDKTFLWSYIGVFLALRAIFLLGAVAWVWLCPCPRRNERSSIGDVVVLWLSFTWISTVILGVPISKAIFGDATKGTFFGLVRTVHRAPAHLFPLYSSCLRPCYPLPFQFLYF